MSPFDVDALRIALEAAGHRVSSIEPMTGGGSNRLFKVILADGALVARVPNLNTAKFALEATAMRAAADAGVPVPRVHDLVAAGPLPILLMEFLEAESLDQTVGGFDEERLRLVAHELGRVLAHIHSLQLGTGFGNLDDDLRGASHSLVDWFIGSMEAVVARLNETAAPEEQRTLERVWSFMLESRQLLTDEDPVFLHGDFRPANLMFRSERLIGVIDWEAAKRGPAALDLAWWDWAAQGSDVPIAANDLIEGYREVRPVDVGASQALRRSALARIAIGHIDWGMRSGASSVVEEAWTALSRVKTGS